MQMNNNSSMYYHQQNYANTMSSTGSTSPDLPRSVGTTPDDILDYSALLSSLLDAAIINNNTTATEIDNNVRLSPTMVNNNNNFNNVKHCLNAFSDSDNSDMGDFISNNNFNSNSYGLGSIVMINYI